MKKHVVCAPCQHSWPGRYSFREALLHRDSIIYASLHHPTSVVESEWKRTSEFEPQTLLESNIFRRVWAVHCVFISSGGFSFTMILWYMQSWITELSTLSPMIQL